MVISFVIKKIYILLPVVIEVFFLNCHIPGGDHYLLDGCPNYPYSWPSSVKTFYICQ